MLAITTMSFASSASKVEIGQRVAIEFERGVAHVRLTRSDKMNALDPAMLHAIIEAGQRVRANPEVRAVVLSGDGRAFCTGLDLQYFQRTALQDVGEWDFITRTHGDANVAQQAVLQWKQSPVPVIAAVHGVAFGGGFQLALGADMRFVDPQTRLSVMEIKWGLVPDMGGTLLMRDLARPDIVADLTFTGRIFSGGEADCYGFATRLCEQPLQEALHAAREIATKNPSAIRAAKRLLSIHDESRTARILLGESIEQSKLIGKS